MQQGICTISCSQWAHVIEVSWISKANGHHQVCRQDSCSMSTRYQIECSLLEPVVHMMNVHIRLPLWRSDPVLQCSDVAIAALQ